MFSKTARTPSHDGDKSDFSIVQQRGSRSFRVFNQAQDALDRPVVEKRHIVRNARVQPTASSAAIQAQVASSLGDPVSSRTIQRRLSEGHLGSRCPLHGLPLTPTYRRLRLECCRARGNWTASESNQVVFSDESRFNLSSDDNSIRLWRSRAEHLNPAFALQRHTTPTAARVSQDCLRIVTTFSGPARSPDLSPIKHTWNPLGRRIGHPTSLNELVGKVEANMERNVSRYHTELVCLNARSYHIVHSRYRGFNRVSFSSFVIYKMKSPLRVTRGNISEEYIIFCRNDVVSIESPLNALISGNGTTRFDIVMETNLQGQNQ
ncbi:transposable element Tcb2 transposase [Trichonephila clavipes]|nr:transposable element Tcb2 transposase [Trichonephila clavipes]